MNQKKRLQILTRLRSQTPHPTTDLVYRTAFELLIAVLLSAQTTDVSVNNVTAKLYPVANTPATLLALGIDGVRTYIKSVGLFNRKAKNVIETCHKLLELHGGEVPANRQALEALPGVGRKTANVVLNTWFGRPTIAVDTHVFRICNRTNFASGKNANLVEKKLLKVVPEEFKLSCHNWLVLFGRYNCIAKNPHCSSCIIKDLCEFKEKNFSLVECS